MLCYLYMENIHEVIKDLIKEGFTERQAEKMATYFYSHNGVATKEDVKDIERRMATKEDVKDIERRMATKEDVKDIERRMATKEDIKTLRWMMGVSFTVIGLLLGAITIILILG